MRIQIFSIWKQMFQWQQWKNKSISGKCLKNLVLLPHRNEKTFPNLRNLCGSALLISGCLNQKLHSPSEKGLAHMSLAGPAMLWSNPSLLGLWWGYRPSSAALCFPPPPAQKPLAMQNCLIFCLAFLHLLKCAKWVTKKKKSSFGPSSSHLGEMQRCGSMGNEMLSPN